jgi:hypothetical protein
MINNKKELLTNIDKLHTTELGILRTSRNLELKNINVVDWCKNKILSKHSIINRQGKNWYINIDNYEITVNAFSYTIITAHKGF